MHVFRGYGISDVFAKWWMIQLSGNFMKTILLTVVLITSVLNVVGAAEPVSNSKSVGVLVQRIHAALPRGWSVSYDKKFHGLDISRDRKVLATVYVINGPPMQKPELTKFCISFRVVDFMSPDDYQKLSAENAKTQKSLSALYEELEKKHISHKFDSFSPDTEEDKAAVARYEAMKKSLHSLPDFYFRDFSLDWVIGSPSSFGPSIYIEDDKIRDECTRVEKKVIGLFSTYEKAEP